MMIQGISSFGSNPIGMGTENNVSDNSKKNTFDKFLNTVSSIEENQSSTKNSIYELLTTGKGDSHEALIAMQKATSEIKTAAVVRDKLIESYQSLINMQI